MTSPWRSDAAFAPTSMVSAIGLDVGGANLKGAHSSGLACSIPFPLWKQPDQLAATVQSVLGELGPARRLALTMTGELADCYPNKAAGVNHIIESVLQAAPRAEVQLWSTNGGWVDVAYARQNPLSVAAANWHAQAAWVGQLFPQSNLLLIDLGTTTCDLIPIVNGLPQTRGYTDVTRLLAGELVYVGARRTPVCAIATPLLLRGVLLEPAAELFATVIDAALVLGLVEEEVANCDTADGRPSTSAAAAARLARCVCADVEELTTDEVHDLARQVHQQHSQRLLTAISSAVQNAPLTVDRMVLSGSGEWLLARLRSADAVEHPREPRTLFRGIEVIRLSEQVSPGAAVAGCAWALAQLASTATDWNR